MISKSRQNRTVQKYFANISAIPEDVRKSFLKKILKRKGASRQKNIKLIKILYSHIETDRINDWDETKICTRLEISKNMLYWHKSSLLKELRKYYFGWGEIEKKEFSSKPEKTVGTDFYYKAKFTYEKAKRMFEIGMRQEAKSVFLNLARNIETQLSLPQRKLRKEKILLLAQIFDYLIRYYYACRNPYRFNLYFSKLEKIFLSKSVILTNQEYSFLQMLFLIAKSLKEIFRALDGANYREALENLFIAHKKAKVSRANEYLFYITILMDEISIRLKHESGDEVKKCIKNAEAVAIRNNDNIKALTLKALEVCFEFETQKVRSNDYYMDTVQQCYESVRQMPRHSCLTILQGMMIRVLGMLGLEEEFIKMTKEVYYSSVIESSKFTAWWKLYIYENMKIDQNRYTWKLEKNSNCKSFIPVIDEINLSGLSKLNNLITQALTEYKNIFSFFVYSAIYQGIILAEFFTETKGNYRRTLMFIRKLQQMEKAKSLNAQNYVDIIKIGIAITEDMDSHAGDFIAVKYGNTITEYINNFLENENGINLIDRYAIIIRIAQITGLKFIWKLAEDFYKKLEEKIPDDIAFLLEQIKNKQLARAS